METTSLTTDQAVESLLAPVENPETEDHETDEATVDPTDADTEGPVSEDAPPEADSDEAELSDDDDADDDFQDDEGEEDADDEFSDLISLQYDGEETQVTLDELKRGYSGQRKVQEGFQQNAEARKQVEAERAQIQQAMQAVGQMYAQLTQQGAIPAPQMPDESLLETDFVGYMQQKDQYDRQLVAYQQQQQQMQLLQQQEQALKAQEDSRYRQAQAKILQEQVPEFADPKNGPKFRDEVRGYLVGQGFPEDVVNGISDALPIALAVKAMKYDQLQAGKKRVAEKTAKARPALKPGVKARPNAKADRKSKMKQAMKTQSVDDWASLLME